MTQPTPEDVTGGVQPTPGSRPDATPAPGPAPPSPDDLATVEQLLTHFGSLEAQLASVREGLAQSHRLATLGTIAAVIAHEYHNILTPIVSYAEMALNDPENRELTGKALRKTATGARKAAQISEALLGFAREEDHRHVARVADVLDDAVACLGRPPEQDRIRLRKDVDVEALVAIAPTKLQQVLVNLLMNARDALRSQGGGELVVATARRKELLEISIVDDGPGVPAAVRDRLFEPFVTLRHEQAHKGTGLGLSICRDLVTEAGGTIRCESSEGSGAAFIVTLPIADELLDPPTTPDAEG